MNRNSHIYFQLIFKQCKNSSFLCFLKYKAELKGIEVIEINEGYTSGTSYIDSELPCVENYNKGRRKYRGLFVSNNKEKINADVNAAYQIGRKASITISYKGKEKVEKIRKVA